MILGHKIKRCSKFLIFLVWAIFLLSFSREYLYSEESPVNGQSKDRRVISYRIKKRFILRPATFLHSLQFRYPLSRVNIPGQEIKGLYVDPNYNALINDVSGNQIAVFYFANVDSGRDINITIGYDIDMQVSNRDLDVANIAGNYTETDSAYLKTYLSSEGDIDVSDPLIKSTVSSITSDAGSLYSKGKAIYDFIVENVTYENIEHESGLQTLHQTLVNKRGNCMDIAKMFIALSRASGLAARQVDGVVFMPNVSSTKSLEKVGHAWAEIYLPNTGWIPVDPTFGISRKKDFYCFNYLIHIPEVYGQVISKGLGSLYRGSSLEVRVDSLTGQMPVSADAEIEIELIRGDIDLNKLTGLN